MRRWFIFFNGKLLLLEGGACLPLCASSPDAALVRGAIHELGVHNGLPCLACAVDRLPDASLFHSPPDENPAPDKRAASVWREIELRASFDLIGPAMHEIAGRAAQLIHWDAHSAFCSMCGVKTVPSTAISKLCPRCGKEIFPSISVAVLVLVRKDDSVFLVRAHDFRGRHYGCVAGFVEAGETLEQCVHREVLEESNMRVANVRYFDSQPWPYPSGLMVGFFADYLDGDLKIQESELSDGRFFQRADLPPLPHPYTLARRMIDFWAAG